MKGDRQGRRIIWRGAKSRGKKEKRERVRERELLYITSLRDQFIRWKISVHEENPTLINLPQFRSRSPESLKITFN